MLYLASDHRGFALKEKMRVHLAQNNVACEDVGAFSYNATDDYPDYAEILARKILADPHGRGIALCGSGAGMAIALNKFDGIRAGTAENPSMAQSQKQDDNINVLVLPADFISDADALKSIDRFLSASFKADPRYQRRLSKIQEIEKTN